MKAQEWLSRYPGLDAEARRLLAKSEELERDPAAKRLQLQALEKQLTATIDEMEAISGAVMRLSDPLERVVLQLRYFDGKQGACMSWKNVAKQIRGRDGEKELSFTYRLHHRALKHLDEIIENT